jgi:hypothetical protein
VAVVKPILGTEVNFNVAGLFGSIADLDGGVVKIGTGFEVPPAGKDDADGLLIGGLQFGQAQTLVVPDALDKAFVDRDGDVVAVGIA